MNTETWRPRVPASLSVDLDGATYQLNFEACREPRCDCGSVVVEALDSRWAPLASVEMVVERGTIQVEEDPLVPHDQRLLAALTPEIKREAIRAYGEQKRLQELWITIARGLTPRDFDGLLWTHAMIPDPSKGWQMLFRMPDGVGYLVDDGYCPDPECLCEDAHALVCRLDPESGVETHVGSVVVDLIDGSLPPHTGTAEALGIVSDIIADHPALISELRRRYDLAKCVGETVFPVDVGRASQPQSRVSANKVGRNDPCPCGSGKKYKKCCLRG